jgi:hypothetical protein
VESFFFFFSHEMGRKRVFIVGAEEQTKRKSARLSFHNRLRAMHQWLKRCDLKRSSSSSVWHNSCDISLQF